MGTLLESEGFSENADITRHIIAEEHLNQIHFCPSKLPVCLPDVHSGRLNSILNPQYVWLTYFRNRGTGETVIKEHFHKRLLTLQCDPNLAQMVFE